MRRASDWELIASECDLVGRWYCTCRMSGCRGEGGMNVRVTKGVDSTTHTYI